MIRLVYEQGMNIPTRSAGWRICRESADTVDQTPFTIMFGPDKCGSTNKVHFIFRHRNPKTGEWEEKHLDNPPAPKITKTTALYTLIVKLADRSAPEVLADRP